MEEKFVRESLEMIVDHFNGRREELGSVGFFEMLAGKLSRLAGKDPAWSWRYVQGVWKGTVGPSVVFGEAVVRMGEVLDDVPAAAAGTVRVQVLARPGQVVEGSVVLGVSKTCRRAGCRVMFVSDNGRRVFCSEECRKLSRREDRRLR